MNFKAFLGKHVIHESFLSEIVPTAGCRLQRAPPAPQFVLRPHSLYPAISENWKLQCSWNSRTFQSSAERRYSPVLYIIGIIVIFPTLVLDLLDSCFCRVCRQGALRHGSILCRFVNILLVHRGCVLIVKRLPKLLKLLKILPCYEAGIR